MSYRVNGNSSKVKGVKKNSTVFELISIFN